MLFSSAGVEVLNYVPFKPPEKVGIYMAIVNGAMIKKVDDTYSDAIWSKSKEEKQKKEQADVDEEVEESEGDTGKKKTRACYRHYYSMELLHQNETYSGDRITLRKPSKGGRMARQVVATHPVYKEITKYIYSATTVHQKTPLRGTFVVYVYIITTDFDLPSQDKPRLAQSVSAEIKLELQHTAPQDALHSYNSKNGNFMSSDPRMLPTISQVRNVARHDKSRNPPTTRGVPENEDPMVLMRLINENVFLKFWETGPEERMICFYDANISLLERCLLPKNIVQTLATNVYQLKNTGNLRNQKFTELVATPYYKEYERAANLQVDTTFDMARHYVTILTCTALHLLNQKRAPATFIVAIMLHARRRREDFEFMVQKLNQKLKVKKCTLIARSLITDDDACLDAFEEMDICKKPCVRLQCGIHLKEIVSHHCNKNIEILVDCFGAQQRKFITLQK